MLDIDCCSVCLVESYTMSVLVWLDAGCVVLKCLICGVLNRRMSLMRFKDRQYGRKQKDQKIARGGGQGK